MKNFLFRNFSRYLGLLKKKSLNITFPNSEHDDGKQKLISFIRGQN